MLTKEQLIAELDESRAVLRRLLHELEAAHATSHELYPTWTVKELLSHITGWDDANIASLRAFARNDVPATPAARGIDPYNASTVYEREALSLRQVIAEWEATREDFKKTIREVPDEKLGELFVMPWGQKGTLEAMVRVFSEHEKEHAQDLEKLINDIRG